MVHACQRSDRRLGVIMGEEVPGIAVVAVVLAHRPPLPIREIRPPLLPRHTLRAGFLQTTMLSVQLGPPFSLRAFDLVHFAFLDWAARETRVPWWSGMCPRARSSGSGNDHGAAILPESVGVVKRQRRTLISEVPAYRFAPPPWLAT